jgi:8-oxo-dGTP pyrophosphatase MutT (NUDIX family)
MAVWNYTPSSYDEYRCDDCVSRGCSCNLYPADGLSWDDENLIEKKDDQGRSYPCCEYDYDKNGFEEYRKAGTMLIIKDGLILGISRRNDKTKFGIVGGKFDLDLDKSMKDTAIRECKEECGIVVNTCEYVCERMEPGGVDGLDFYSACYYATNWTGDPIDSEEGKVAWLTAEELTITKAAFGDYNRHALDVFKKKYPDVYIKGE